MTRFLRRLALVLLLAVLWDVHDAGAQAAKGKYPVAVRGLPTAQNTLKTDNSVTPNVTEVGCETDQESTTTVNGLTLKGAAAGSSPTIAPKACTGGDAAITLQLTDLAGNVEVGTKTDWTEFYAAPTNCVDTTASTAAVVVRAAANDVSLQRTAAGAETHNFDCLLTEPVRTTGGKGWKLTGFSVVHQITVAALTSNTFNALATTTYANNVADAVAAYGGSITITMPTATQANPYVTTGTVGTPAFMNTSGAGISVDWSVVMQNTGVYSLKGIIATWTTQD